MNPKHKDCYSGILVIIKYKKTHSLSSYVSRLSLTSLSLSLSLAPHQMNSKITTTNCKKHHHKLPKTPPQIAKMIHKNQPST
jgi:hypothetical protein